MHPLCAHPSDGLTWTTVTDPAPANTWRSIVWSASLTRYVGISGDGTARTLVGIVPAVTPPATGGTGGGTTTAAPARPTLAEGGVDAAPWGLTAALLIAAGVLLRYARRRPTRP
jgi:hypothetical protein